MRGMVAGVAAASALALGGALVAPPQEARADLLSDALAGAGSLQGIIGSITAGADSVLAPIADQWRMQICAAEGVQRGGADCSLSTNIGVAVVAPGNLEMVPSLAIS
ncbi:hypothetical protein nbrc107697_27290 [Gordonia crocea]|uniref:Uncharacterized protein n=2 Tax=Gordonia crocea TaxID=589162 RepID=A0A7I9V0V6_9ACTN|nr:hypothetical protein nbrc107697_27290 [Gordonia crocea]